MTSEGKVKYSWSLPDRQKILARGGNEGECTSPHTNTNGTT